jgi:hypothetical protein
LLALDGGGIRGVLSLHILARFEELLWDDIDPPKRTIIVRRLKGSTDSVHYLERDELNGLKLLRWQQQADGFKGAYVFINERGQPFGRMGVGRMIERAGEAARIEGRLSVVGGRVRGSRKRRQAVDTVQSIKPARLPFEQRQLFTAAANQAAEKVSRLERRISAKSIGETRPTPSI